MMLNSTIEVAEVFRPLFSPDYLNYILEAGRDSGKTKTADILVGITTAIKPNEDIVICRASYGSIADSVYNEVCEVFDSIDAFEGQFEYRKSPLRIQRKNSSSTIYFMGIGGSTERTKGFKPKNPVSLVIVEEAQELKSKEHLDQTLASLRRRFGKDCKVIIIFNPPAQELHWINVWANQMRNDQDWCVIHSSWMDIAQFLSDRDIKEILKCKYENPDYYEYMYMGKPTGKLGSVFPMFRKDRHVITAQEFEVAKAKGNLRPVGCIIGGDGAVNRDATAFTAWIILNNGQAVLAPIFYHNPKDDGVLGYHQLVQDHLTRWFDEVCARFRLGTRQERREHPQMQVVPIWMRIDSAAPDLIQECRFFLGDRADIGPIKKLHVPQMVATTQSAICNDNLVIIDYGGYYSYVRNKWIKREVNLLAEQWSTLIWNEKQDNYDPIVPNDVSDSAIYIILFWYGNQENIQYFNILKARNLQITKIRDIIKDKE